MTHLYVGFIKKGYEIPESVEKRYGIEVGDTTPWTHLKVISAENIKIDIKEIKNKAKTFDIKEAKSDVIDIDIKEIVTKNVIDIKEIKK